jgi:hypothetical protein
MKASRSPRVAVLIGAVFLGSTAEASFLSLVPKQDIVVDTSKMQVRVTWSVKNEGDERAKDVVLDLPQLNESYPLSKDMAPGDLGAVKHTQVFSFDQLSVKEKGEYALIYRILYKDANFYPFSAPHVAMVTIPPAPSRALHIQFEDGDREGPFELSDKLRVRFEVTNRSTSPVKLMKIEPVFANELITKLVTDSEMGELAPDASYKAKLEIERKGALTGSVYFIGLVASGVTLGQGESKHFAQQADVRVAVLDSAASPRKLIGIVIGLIAAALVVVWIFQKRK